MEKIEYKVQFKIHLTKWNKTGLKAIRIIFWLFRLEGRVDCEIIEQ